MQNQNKSFRPCVIHVGKNEKLMELAVEIAKKHSKREFQPQRKDPGENCVVLYSDGDFLTTEEPLGVPPLAGFPRFDLTTQPLTALLEYLDGEEEKPADRKFSLLNCDCEIKSEGSLLCSFAREFSVYVFTPEELDTLALASRKARGLEESVELTELREFLAKFREWDEATGKYSLSEIIDIAHRLSGEKGGGE